MDKKFVISLIVDWIVLGILDVGAIVVGNLELAFWYAIFITALSVASMFFAYIFRRIFKTMFDAKYYYELNVRNVLMEISYIILVWIPILVLIIF